jgi:hypothetical protein
MAEISISDRKITITDGTLGNLSRLRPDALDAPQGTLVQSVDEFGNPQVPISTTPDGEGATIDSPELTLSVQPPGNITVEKQEVKVAGDGSAKIDVTLSFDEVDGAANYEARVTKE